VLLAVESTVTVESAGELTLKGIRRPKAKDFEATIASAQA
jgi:hypothetical protein